MANSLFLKRIVSNKIYWLSVLAALVILFCSIVHWDTTTGQEYIFLSLLYNEEIRMSVSAGQLLYGYDSSYLWMFAPIIVGVPCILAGKTERFVLFRTSKNKYIFSKYVANLVASGMLLVMAYFVYMLSVMAVFGEFAWNELLTKKLLSIFCWGILCALPSMLLSELVHNKYLILCVPFVLNYFVIMFVGRILPYEIYRYISPTSYQTLFLDEPYWVKARLSILLVCIVGCGAVKKLLMEGRCDCGQR